MREPDRDMDGVGLAAFLRVLDPTDNAVGGGTASAVAGAMGAALVAMVGRLSSGKAGMMPESFYQPIIWEAEALARELMERGGEDAQAFDGVLAAYRLPRKSEEEKGSRRDAVDRAMVKATLVPLQNAKRCRRVLELQQALQGKSNENAASDLCCAGHLALAGLQGCLDNVRINLPSLTDSSQAGPIRVQADELNRFAARTLLSGGFAAETVSQ